MINRLKDNMNKIYSDNTIGFSNGKKRLIYLIKQRVTKKDIDSFLSLCLLKKKGVKDRITVVFILQMPEIWNKQSLIYQQMKTRTNFHIIILAVPEYNIITNSHNFENNTAYEFAVREGMENVIKADKLGDWQDLKELSPDYVFYQRPYEEYLPIQYSSREVIKYSKTCYIPYAFFASTTGEMTMEYERSFARNIYFNFVSSIEMKKLVSKKFFLTSKLGLRRIESVGIPILENVLREKANKEKINVWSEWGCSEDSFKILWTPRWSTERSLGGSHFFLYKDSFVKYAKSDSKVFVAFRPHPLAFQNYIRNKLMSEEEVLEYEEIYSKSHNMVIDKRKKYIDTFWNTDLLITDISSMMVEFFVTGKPIIFCGTDLALNEMHIEIINTLYQADSWEDIEIIIEELKQGNDWMQEKRRGVIEKWFGEIDLVSKKIVDMIEADTYISNQ